MNANDPNDREMERLLEEHFASGADNVPPTPDLWVLLEGRLGGADATTSLGRVPRLGVSGRGFPWSVGARGDGSSSGCRGSSGRRGDSGLDMVRGRQQRRHPCGSGTSGYSHPPRDANADDGVSYSALGYGCTGGSYGCTGGGYSCTSCPHTVRNTDANGDDGGPYTVPAWGYGGTANGCAAPVNGYAAPRIASPRRSYPSAGAAIVIRPARSDHVRGLRASASDRCTRGRRFHVQPGH